MTYAAEHTIADSSFPMVRPRQARASQRRLRCSDKRWPALAAALATLRSARRRSVRIVDTDCGTGTLLICAVRYARAIGFTSIEARGIDAAPALVGRASAAAAAMKDPAIGITFEAANLADALQSETDFPADIVVWRGCAGCSAEEVGAVSCAGHLLIADPATAA